MKKLILLFIAFFALNTLNGMEQKSIDKTQQEPGTFDILTPETADMIMATALENHIQEMDQLTSLEEFKKSFDQFFKYLFSARKIEILDDTGKHVQSIYILTPQNIKKFIKSFAYQVFALRKGNFILPEFVLEKIRNAYPQIGEILGYKNDLWALIASKKITDYTSLRGKEIKSLKGFHFLRDLPNYSPKELFLAYNQLTTVPDTLGQLTNLEDLDLAYNQLTTVPDTLGQLTNLESLFLSYNQLTTVPDTLGLLTNLEDLYLSKNPLTLLPDTLGKLTKLKHLYLSNNQLTMLPDTLRKFINLESLFLSYNQLATVPETLNQLTNLKYLDLSNNKLTSLPDTLNQLTNLKHLDLSDNKLTTVPETLNQLTNLKYLDLSDNQFNEEQKKEIKEKLGTKIKTLKL